MARSVAWQRSITDLISWNQDQALNSTIYILREVGPTSFLLKEEGETKKFSVRLGDPHECSCTNFRQEKSLCKHICWVLLKRFKLNRFDELSYQLGLVQREINELLKGPVKTKLPLKNLSSEAAEGDAEKHQLQEQRPLTEEDVCPICQDHLLAKHMPVTYCRHGCGNSVHIKCMKVWADHQQQSTEEKEIRCPFCRNIFGSRKLLEQEVRSVQFESRNPAHKFDCHPGVSCHVCKMSPLKGKCYQCVTCSQYFLCNTCYHGHKHMHHQFVYRLKKSQRWRPAPARNDIGCADLSLNPATMDLQNRDLTENDYELLLELDRPSGSHRIPVDLAGLPEHLINKIPLAKVRVGSRLLAPGRQCRLCLRSYVEGQHVRKLPSCGHTFHRDCIDKWLTEDHRCCPIDRSFPLEFEKQEKVAKHKSAPSSSVKSKHESDAELVIPGIGLIHLSPASRKSSGETASLNCRLNTHERGNNEETQKQAGDDFGCFNSDDVDRHEVTFSDILIEASAIEAAGNKISSSSSRNEPFSHEYDLGAEQIRLEPISNINFGGPFSLDDSVAGMTSSAHPNENRRPPRRRKPETHSLPKSQVPLFPKNRKENFSLSVVKLEKPTSSIYSDNGDWKSSKKRRSSALRKHMSQDVAYVAKRATSAITRWLSDSSIMKTVDLSKGSKNVKKVEK